MSNIIFIVFNEYAHNWQLGFQVPATPIMEGIVRFHHDLFFFLTMILIFVIYILGRCITQFNKKVNPEPIIVIHAPTLEIIWTIIPALILIIIALPSFALLYSIDYIETPLITIKIIGHQWYWSYEFLDPSIIIKNLLQTNTEFEGKNLPDFIEDEKICSYDSYMATDDAVPYRHQRLLKVDNKLYLPVQTHVRLLVTSADVIHSWAVPALGIKLDACPGRLNQTNTFIQRPGNFYGQCSEICGVNHGFMPINVAALDIYAGADILAGGRYHKSETLKVVYNAILKRKFM